MKYHEPGPNPGNLFLVVLAIITALLPLSLHLFFPALPFVMSDFGASEAAASLTVSAPLFVMAISSLFYGSLSDNFGRRPILLGSITIFVVGSIVSAVADTIWMLIAGRILQAAGGGGGLGLARAIAHDVFGADRLVKVISYLTMAYALGPMISAPIGGMLVEWSGWRAVLTAAAVFGIVIGFAVWWVLFETRPERGDRVTRLNPLRDYLKLFSDLRFTAYVLQSGFTSSVFFTMAAASSFLMIEYLERPPSEYGFYFICFPLGFLLGSLVASRFAGRISVEMMVLAGSLVGVAGTLIQSGFLFAAIVTPLTIFLPGILAIIAQGIALPNAQAGAINAAGPLAGTAAGIGVFIQLLGAGISIQIYGIVADGSPIPMALVVLVCAVLALTFGAIPFLLRALR